MDYFVCSNYKMSVFLFGVVGLLCVVVIKIRYLKNWNSLMEVYGCDVKGRCDMIKVIDLSDKIDVVN